MGKRSIVRDADKTIQVLFAISNAVHTADNLQALYKSIHSILASVLDVTNFMIGIYDRKKDIISYPYYADEVESDYSDIENVQSSGILASEIIRSATPFFITRKEIIARKKKRGDRGLGAIPEQWFGVPLKIKDQVVGVIAVQSYTDPDLYSEKDVGMLLSVSEQVAMAIDRKRSQEIIIEREKQIRLLSKQTQEFSLVAASIISMKDDREIFRYISKAIVKHSDFRRVVLLLFKAKPSVYDIIAFEGIDRTIIDKLKKVRLPDSWYDEIIGQGEKIGRFTYFIPHTIKHILYQKAAIFGKAYLPGGDYWHPENNLFVEMRDQAGVLTGIIWVDGSKTRGKPTNETVRPLEIFSSLISQIMIFRKIQNELKDHKENLQKKIAYRTKELTAEINERIQAEKRLKKARLEAEEAARVKGEFLTNMSHEIRTPINGIMGMAEIALGSDLDDDLRQIIKTIDSEASALLTIINKILDFSKIEAGKLVLENIAFNLKATFEKACFLVAMGMGKKDIEFISFFAPDVPERLIGDPGRLRQILLNLAGNAMKFTHHGEIFLKAEVVKDYETEVEIKFIVKDTGIGIEKDKQKSIFESFNQADGSTTRKYGGTGLGTTIAKQLVDLMGGKIGLESEAGKGTTFWFSIKFLKQKKPKDDGAAPEINLRGLRILLVDDNRTNRFVLTEYLKSFGIEPVVVESRKEGIHKIRQGFVDNKGFDSVIINLKHSNDGAFEFAWTIRKNKDFVKLPIIMLASTGEMGDGQMCKKIGIDAYLLKPVRQDELKRALAKVIYNFSFDRKEQQLITRHTIAEELQKSIHILVVEDYPTNQQIILRHLKNAGYRASLAENGRVAVDLFKKGKFDLIMMDIQMPVMDGYQAAKLMRGYESKISYLKVDDNDKTRIVKSRTPIIAMTAHAITDCREKCLKAGMDDYISKPLRREKFLDIVAKWTSMGRRISREDKIKTRFEIVDKPGGKDNDPGRLPAREPMDFSTALNEFENDREFLLEILKSFLGNVEKQFFSMENAINNNNGKIVEMESHSIKSGAVNLTAYDLSRAAGRLEQIGKSRDLSIALKAYKNLKEEFSRLKSFIAQSDF